MCATVKTVRELMSDAVFWVDPDMTLSELAQFLTDHEISGTVVCSERGKPCGVVSLSDLAAATARAGVQPTARPRSDFYERSWEDALDEWDTIAMSAPEGQLTVVDIMTPELVSVAIDAPVSEVARVMLENHLHRVLVEDDQGLAGIVSTSDLLRLLCEDESSSAAYTS